MRKPSKRQIPEAEKPVRKPRRKRLPAPATPIATAGGLRGQASNRPVPNAAAIWDAAASYEGSSHTPDQIERTDRAWVARCLVQGMTNMRMLELAHQRKPVPLDEATVLRYAAEWRRNMKAELQATREYWRDEQIAMVRANLEQAQLGSLVVQGGKVVMHRGPDGVERPLRQRNESAIQGWANLLSELTGTKAPKKIDLDAHMNVELSVTLGRVVQSISPERMAALVAEQLDLERRAGLVRAAS